MSFSFEFIGRTRQHALKLLERQAASNCPDTVRSFIATAIENIPAPAEGEVRLIKVVARGHLCIGKEWSAFSSAHIEVAPIAASPD